VLGLLRFVVRGGLFFDLCVFGDDDRNSDKWYSLGMSKTSLKDRLNKESETSMNKEFKTLSSIKTSDTIKNREIFNSSFQNPKENPLLRSPLSQMLKIGEIWI
jgi:hypothetical protein